MTDYALVTGAARNIGRAIATRLKADGLKVIMLDLLDPEDPSLGDFRRVDLSDTTDTAQALAWAMDGRRITRVVNCAGLVSVKPVEEVDTETFNKLMAVNVRSYIEVMKATAPAMKEAKFGRVVNIASRSALGFREQTVYAATKAAVVGMTKTWAQELAAHGITVNAVGPGPIETDMLREVHNPGSAHWDSYKASIPVQRFGQPEDIANGVSFFLDERSGFVTGQCLFICGGMTIGRANAT
jgi:NAD(P)-dependent dehydrogenase (short-subunit alcohol dehydrogenase family)